MVTNGAESPLAEDDESPVGETFVRNNRVVVGFTKEKLATLRLTKASDFLEIHEASIIKMIVEDRGRRNMTKCNCSGLLYEHYGWHSRGRLTRPTFSFLLLLVTVTWCLSAIDIFMYDYIEILELKKVFNRKRMRGAPKRNLI